MDYAAHLEITGGIIRVRRQGMLITEPFEFLVPMIGDEGEAMLKGALDPPALTRYRTAIELCLLRHDFHAVRWRRRDGEASREFRCLLRKPAASD